MPRPYTNTKNVGAILRVHPLACGNVPLHNPLTLRVVPLYQDTGANPWPGRLQIRPGEPPSTALGTSKGSPLHRKTNFEENLRQKRVLGY